MRTVLDIFMAILAVIILAFLAYLLTHRYFGYQAGYQTTGYRYYTVQPVQQVIPVQQNSTIYYSR